MKIKLEWELPATIRKKGKWYVSSCPFLDVYSQGRTREEARCNIVDALASFLMSCYERGTLDAVLRDAGLVAVAQPRAPESFLRGRGWRLGRSAGAGRVIDYYAAVGAPTGEKGANLLSGLREATTELLSGRVCQTDLAFP